MGDRGNDVLNERIHGEVSRIVEGQQRDHVQKFPTSPMSIHDGLDAGKWQSSPPMIEEIAGIFDSNSQTLIENCLAGEICEKMAEESDLPLPKLYSRTVPSIPILTQMILSRGRSHSPKREDCDLKNRLRATTMTCSMPNFFNISRASHNRMLGQSLASSECQRSQSETQQVAVSRVEEFTHLLRDL